MVGAGGPVWGTGNAPALGVVRGNRSFHASIGVHGALRESLFFCLSKQAVFNYPSVTAGPSVLHLLASGHISCIPSGRNAFLINTNRAKTPVEQALPGVPGGACSEDPVPVCPGERMDRDGVFCEQCNGSFLPNTSTGSPPSQCIY